LFNDQLLKKLDKSMRFLLLSLFLFFTSGSLLAQNGRPSGQGARGMAMGYSSVAFTGINNAFGNPAGLAGLKTFEAALFAQQRFLIGDLSDFSMAAAIPTSSGVLGLSLQYFGVEAYNEQKIGLVYARPLMEKLSIGAQIDFLNTRIPEYGNAGLLTFGIGFHSQLSEQISLGGHLYSPVRVALTEDEDLPTLLTFGLFYQPSKQLGITAELVKHIDYEISVRAGIEYSINKVLFLRVGTMTQPSQVTFGLGLALENGLKIDVASAYHSTLGISPGIGIRYAGKGKK